MVTADFLIMYHIYKKKLEFISPSLIFAITCICVNIILKLKKTALEQGICGFLKKKNYFRKPKTFIGKNS